MTIYKEFNIGGGKGSPFGSFGPALMLILSLVVLYFLAKGIFSLLYWAAPVLLILTLVIDYKVVLDFGKFIFKLLKDNLPMGIIAIVLTFLGYPVVSGYLFFKALMRRQIKKAVKSNNPEIEFSEYEEVKEEDFLELPSVQKEKRDISQSGNEYDNLFD